MQQSMDQSFVSISNRQVNKINMLDFKNEGMIHDAAYDYFGHRIALGASDGKIHIYDVTPTTQKTDQKTDQKAENPTTQKIENPIPKLENPKKGIPILAHSGPIWQISWSHPRFGNQIAAGSFDKSVSIWQEKLSNWELQRKFDKRSGSVNTVAWAQNKLILATGQSDGSVVLYVYKTNWEQIEKKAHSQSVNSVSWLNQDDGLIFASGGSDKRVILWSVDDNQSPVMMIKLREINLSGLVRSVSWAADLYNSQPLLAIGMENHLTLIYSLDTEWDHNNDPVKIDAHGPCWRVSWSPLGNQLAISSIKPEGECIIRVYQQNEDNQFTEI